METGGLSQRQKIYEVLLQSVTDYVIAINRNYQIIMANDLFKNEFGMYQNGFCYDVWKNRDERCEGCLVQESFQDGQVHWNEENVVMKDGRIAQMLVKSTPVKDDQGKVVYVLEAATDITEKKRLQEELKKLTGKHEEIIGAHINYLQKSEERYRTIFERSRDALILTDSKGKIIEINQAGIEILGYKNKEQLLRVRWDQEFFEEQEDLYKYRTTVLKQGFVTEFETRLSGKGKRTFDALITSNVTLDLIGQISGYVIIIRDINKRKKAQKQIERINTRIAMLNAISTTMSSSLDLNEILNSTINDICELLEADSARIYLLDKNKNMLILAAHKGLSERFISISHVKQRKVGAGFLGRAVFPGETRVVDNIAEFEKPYAEFIIEEGLHSTAYIPLVSKGESVGVLCVSSHVFEFSDDYLDALTGIGNQIGVAVDNANLYESINTAYQELKEAQEQVIRTEKLASLGKLAASIAHEINNPLAAVLTYIRLMMKLMERNRFKPERLEDISRYLITMESEIARCGEIVRNLLAFSRQSRINMQDHRVEEIIEKTMVLIAHNLEMKNIKREIEIKGGMQKVCCDFKQIQQVLLNIIGNASEAMPEGGILTVVSKPSSTGGFIDIVVSDTGQGIPEEDLKSIFEPFFTTKEEGKGVGLGLSVAYGIIARHKGAIEVESEQGKGSVFKVSLPIAR
jgi:two-component system NtrC family sensor kinase